MTTNTIFAAHQAALDGDVPTGSNVDRDELIRRVQSYQRHPATLAETYALIHDLRALNDPETNPLVDILEATVR